jgi:hypothetical protein
MEHTDPTLIHWVDCNLGIAHDQLTREDAERWKRLLQDDPEKFFSHAIYGFVTKRSCERGQKQFEGEELGQFCAEFRDKVHLASDNRTQRGFALPLFDIVEE